MSFNSPFSIFNIFCLQFFASLFILLFCVSVSALDVRITEFLYNAEGADGGKEYVEIINLGPESVDVGSLRFVENDRLHIIRESRGGATLSPGTIAVIVDNPEEFSSNYSYRGILLDSSFSLSNSGTTLKITSDNSTLHSIRYTSDDGASGDGKSLNVSSSNRVSASTPSIGSVPSSITSLVKKGSMPAPKTTSTSKSTSTKKTTLKNDSDAIHKPAAVDGEYIFITNPNIIFAASTTTFSIVDKDRQDDSVYGLWNFGDGSVVYGDDVEYEYLYPGKYIISFESIDLKNSEEHVSFKETVTVIRPNVSIERVDGSFIRFVNNHSFNLDISKWRILSNENIFEFPVNTFVPSRSKVTVSFFSNNESSIFFITSGGGQFLGYEYVEPVIEDEIELDEDAESIEETSEEEIEEDKEETEEETEEEDAAVEAVKEENTMDDGVGSDSVENGNNVLNNTLKNVENELTEDNRIQKRNRIIVIWVSIFLGLFALVLAPLFITEAENKKKNKKRKIRKIKK